jgi:hypothetical protein
MNIIGKITTFEVRCACGKSCENAEAYGQHKSICSIHRKEENAVSITARSNRKFATIPAKASISASSPKPVACWCGRTFRNNHVFREHGRYCAMYKQQTNARSASSDPAKSLELNSGASSVSAAGEHPIPLADSTAKKIQCPCGQSFGNEKALNKHLRYSKTHQLKNSGSVPTSKAKTPGSVPFMAPHSPPTSVPPTSGPVPGTIPLSVLPLASPFPYTYGHVFKTQRVLDLHKRNSLFHKQQADESPTRNEQWDDSLVSSFASLRLESVPTRVTPSVGGFTCVCGCEFTNRKALEQHERDARGYAGQKIAERKKKIFSMPRSQYQADEDLRDLAAVLARQYSGWE